MTLLYRNAQIVPYDVPAHEDESEMRLRSDEEAELRVRGEVDRAFSYQLIEDEYLRLIVKSYMEGTCPENLIEARVYLQTILKTVERALVNRAKFALKQKQRFERISDALEEGVRIQVEREIDEDLIDVLDWIEPFTSRFASLSLLAREIENCVGDNVVTDDVTRSSGINVIEEDEEQDN